MIFYERNPDFQNEEFGEIRTLEINGQCYFAGADVAKALGYAKPRNAIARYVDKEDALKWGIPSNGGIQQMTMINESGLYSLALSSKLDRAKKFRHWITSEVLPSIRRTGTYRVSDIEKVVDRMFEEKIEAIISRVLDEKTDNIVKTLDEHSDRRMNKITASIKESITEISCTTAQSLIPCFMYTHKKIKELYNKLKNE